MSITTLVINDVKPLDFSSKIQEAQLLFNNLTYSHIVIENNGVFMGCLSETDAHCFEADKTLKDINYSLEPFFVRHNDNWLDVLEAFASNGSNIMPVLDHKGVYLGYYEFNDVMTIFNETPFLSEPGAVLVIEKGFTDYSFGEVAQIVESNGAKLLGAFVSKIENDLAQITLKVGNGGINEILAAFRRYSYNVISSNEEDSHLEDLRKRSDYLDRYLNMGS